MNYTREQTDLADDIFASLATSPDHAVPRSSSSLYSAMVSLISPRKLRYQREETRTHREQTHESEDII